MSDNEPSVEQNQTPAINNVDRDLRNAGARRGERTQNNVNPRDRLFHALFIKIGNIYSRIVPKRFRIVLEAIVLIKGLLLFSFLSYLHFSFGRSPMNCLSTSNGSWPRDGILRVQIQPELALKRELPRFYSHRNKMVLFHPCHADKSYNPSVCNSMSAEIKDFYEFKSKQHDLKSQSYRMNLSDFLFERNNQQWKIYQDFEYVLSDRSGSFFSGFNPGEIINEGRLLAFYEKYLVDNEEPERHYIFEYSQEFGFLRLSQETRTRLKIPIKVITLDPYKEKCFGDAFSRFSLKYFLGYDDILMNSIKKVADAENNTGYMLNVVTGDHYKFVPWGIGRGSYVISLCLMFLFTISISTLLRYCHQQVFFFIIHVLQMLDMNIVLAFPVAPLFTVVLSLVGMETIMSEYFNDTTTSFYIILIVWAVDQFDTICCHTVISQKYWLRFFYLYHFIFYAYHYRFNGQYSSLALAATWFLIQHSMLYFFHNYELPAIENNPNNIRRDEEAYLDEAVQMIVEGIELVAGQQQQQTPPAPETPAPQPPTQVNNENTDNTEEAPQDVNRLREISTGTNGSNRIFIFAADRPFIQMVRDFIGHVHDRMNAERTEPQVNNDESEANQNNDNQENEVSQGDENDVGALSTQEDMTDVAATVTTLEDTIESFAPAQASSIACEVDSTNMQLTDGRVKEENLTEFNSIQQPQIEESVDYNETLGQDDTHRLERNIVETDNISSSNKTYRNNTRNDVYENNTDGCLCGLCGDTDLKNK